MSSLSTMSEPRAELARAQSAINEALARFADRHLAGTPDTVRDAIRYSLLGEGKRMRGILVLSAYEAAGGAGDASELAAAVEVVHAYSLVHDDLPCMDDDDMRRGRPTVHKVFGVAAATAAGLAMVPLAALCAAEAARALALDDAAVGSIVADLMRASGAGGMIGGQLLDLEGEGRPLALADLERIHRAKTGALITAAATVGGRAASASGERLAALARYGEAVGLAFQIADDVLDVTATTDQLGKTAGRDLALRKSTYPALLGVEGAKGRAAALIDDGCRALREVGLCTPALEWIARFSVERTS
ncbi:MAG TPA: farnesyl diphosphate synthase [Gemmatimonadaceae bacterium]|nr:farnesyl diphosphate synthase [Gemmatimonadaceae bacterium]